MVNNILYNYIICILINQLLQIHQVDTRTDQQKAEDLLQQYYEQVQLSSTNDPFVEIQERLTALHKDDNTVSKKCSNFKN
jgi:hypothetical protein